MHISWIIISILKVLIVATDSNSINNNNHSDSLIFHKDRISIDDSNLIFKIIRFNLFNSDLVQHFYCFSIYDLSFVMMIAVIVSLLSHSNPISSILIALGIFTILSRVAIRITE